jgi:hypothetical protein
MVEWGTAGREARVIAVFAPVRCDSAMRVNCLFTIAVI